MRAGGGDEEIIRLFKQCPKGTPKKPKASLPPVVESVASYRTKRTCRNIENTPTFPKKDSENDGRNHQEFCAGIIGFENRTESEKTSNKTEIPEKTVHEYENLVERA